MITDLPTSLVQDPTPSPSCEETTEHSACGSTRTSINRTWPAVFRAAPRTRTRRSTSSWGANPRRTTSRFVFCAEDQIGPRWTSCALSSDLELWLHKQHPRVMYYMYYTLLGIAAVRLGPGQPEIATHSRPLKTIVARDTFHWIFMSPTSHLKESPCGSKPTSRLPHPFCRTACILPA